MPRASLDKQPRDVAGMFDAVAARYEITNDILSMGQDRLWRRATRAEVAALPGQRVLDLAAGTGSSSAPFADGGVDVVPCDFSTGMVRRGKARRPHLAFVAGDAMALPFADASFDAVTISFGLRNVLDPVAALREMLRVTRPGGRVVVCEFSTPTWGPWRAVYGWYLRHVLPRVARLVSSNTEAYTYLAESIDHWPDQAGLVRLLQDAGWQSVGYRNLSGGIVALHHGTRGPDEESVNRAP